MVLPELFKERTAVHSNVEDGLLAPEIKAAQDLYILPILGTALFDKILNDINANVIAGDYKTLLDDYLIDTICNYVISELPIGLNYQFYNKGVTAKTSDNAQSPSMGELFDIVNKYKNRAEAYQKKTILYLKQSASQGKFPEYLNPGSGVDTIIPERNAYSSPIYLGEEYPKHKRSYEEKYQGNIFRSDC